MEKENQIAINEEIVQDLIAAIYDASGYDFSNYSMPSLHRRFQRFFDMKKITDIPAFVDRLHEDAFLLNEFIEEITVNVTEMFRDPHFFEILKKEIVPQLKLLPSVKIWHAGCSTGEEPYSMAIILQEEGLLDKSIIYATDINQSVLNKASKGRYPLDLLKSYEKNYRESNLGPDFSVHYEINEGDFVIKEAIRKKIIFSTHNLGSDSAFNQFDLIICRNVMIYFNKQLQDTILSMFYSSLNPTGFLALGSKETILFSSIEKLMDTYNYRNKIWRKTV